MKVSERKDKNNDWVGFVSPILATKTKTSRRWGTPILLFGKRRKQQIPFGNDRQNDKGKDWVGFVCPTLVTMGL
jgi:hypothetical protein